MKAGRFFNGWVLVALLLVGVIIAGGVVIRLKSDRGQAVEIASAPERQMTGKIYVGGVVNNPGWYPLFDGDSIADVVRTAGGIKNGVDISRVELTFCVADDEMAPQKININLAEAWLLEALPDIGETKAQAIIDYREKNGLFRDIYELEKVPGFGESIIAKIKDLITVK